MPDRRPRSLFCSAGLTLISLIIAPQTPAQEPCGANEVFEPYSQVCAPVNDRRDWWLTPSEVPIQGDATQTLDFDSSEIPIRIDKKWPRPKMTDAEDPPEAGAINVGTTYLNGTLRALTSARLHTKMFVYPQGLNPSGFLDWTFMPATNRADSAVEVVAIYRTALGNSGVLSIYARPCSLEFPCPDGKTSNGWQPSKYFTELTCNITHIVDEGGHAQKIVHYANHSDKIDDADPPLWNDSVYLWNYCDDRWDLIWQHTYRENKRDCSIEGCSWWGPGVELPGSTGRPEIAEIGYEDSLLFHDGVWSLLPPSETGFRRPEDYPQLSPWQLFHQNPNQSFGAGNYLDLNDPPDITGQLALETGEDIDIQVSSNDVAISDPDVDPAYHSEFVMTVYGGQDYSHDGLTISPDENFFGELQVPVSVSDGDAESDTYTLIIGVAPINDEPMFTGVAPIAATEGILYSYQIEVVDVDGDPITIGSTVTPQWLTLSDYGDGTGTLTGVPAGIDVGMHSVTLIANDGNAPAQSQTFTVTVSAAPGGPEITILGSNPLTLNQNQAFLDPGATALDVQDGNLTASISVTGAVNSAVPGTYRINYTVSDSAGNSSSASRTVIVRAAITTRSSGGGGISALEVICWALFALFTRRLRMAPVASR